jgi:hypothetical protein
MTTKQLTPTEEAHLETIKMWLDSMRDWFAFASKDDDEVIVVDGLAPDWVRVCAKRIDGSLFAPVNAVLGEGKLTPYRLGYALGLMKWGSKSMHSKPPPEVKLAVKGIRLSRKARRQLVRMCEDFFISVQIAVRKKGRLQFSGQPEMQYAERLAKKYTGLDESEFHRGLSDGLRGVGKDTPGDRSTNATDVYLMLVIWWRFIVRLPSVTQLHVLITKCLGPARAGERKRVEKICERIGLTLREVGRPTIIPTPPLPG